MARSIVGLVLLTVSTLRVGDFGNTDSTITTTCPVTKLSERDAPAYYNADRSMSIIDVRGWHAGAQGVKVPWTRPAGVNLTIEGRRLDADGAGTLRADVRCCYSSYFQATRLYFESPGCWEIVAHAGDHELKFVTEVAALGPVRP